MPDRPNNAFLLGLDTAGYARLSENLIPVELVLGTRLMDQGDAAKWVYFPESCLLSLISLSRGGQGVETSMVGSEGAAGLLEACGSGQSSVDCLVQVDGRAWRSPADLCRKLAYSDDAFAARAWRLVELQTAESRQSAVCQALHQVESRFARWLLESLERSRGRNPLPMTQEFLAAMLGVQRTTVSGFASQLQKEGLITYNRGRLTVDDVEGLERVACECRRTTSAQRARLGFSVPAQAPSPAASGLDHPAHPRAERVQRERLG